MVAVIANVRPRISCDGYVAMSGIDLRVAGLGLPCIGARVWPLVAAAAVNAPLFVIILVDIVKLEATSDATVADSAR